MKTVRPCTIQSKIRKRKIADQLIQFLLSLFYPINSIVPARLPTIDLFNKPEQQDSNIKTNEIALSKLANCKPSRRS